MALIKKEIDDKKKTDEYFNSGKEKKKPIKVPDLIEVIGSVVKTYPVENNSSRFVIVDPNTDQQYECIYNGFFPVREGDCMEVVLTKHYVENQYIIENKPFVQPTMTKNGIIEFFTKVSRFKFNSSKGTPLGNRQASKLYKELDYLTELRKNGMTDDRKAAYNITTLISSLAEEYNQTGNISLIDSFSIDPSQMKKILFYWYKDRMRRRLYLLGLNNKQIDDTELDLDTLFERCVSNPYTVPQLDFEACSDIMKAQRKSPTVEMKYCGKVVRELWKMLDKRGWACVKRSKLLEMFPNMEKYEEELQREYHMVLEMECYYFYSVNAVERAIFRRIQEITFKNNGNINLEKRVVKPTTVDEVDPNCGIFKETAYLDSFDSEDDTINLTDEQKSAIQGALDNPISIITGPAGSGKTSVVRCIIKNLRMRNIRYAILSFTGKAVSRLNQVLQTKEAKTIHRFINSMIRDDKERDDMKLGHVIIDETSMVTFSLFCKLMNVCPMNTFFTFVGDPDQLPPISWGSFFEQIIISRTVPIFKLTKTHRVKDVTHIDCITTNANFIRNYTTGPVDLMEGENFSIVNGNQEKVISLAKSLKSRGIPSTEFIVITPVNAEIKSMNNKMQKIFCGENKYVVDKYGNKWHNGDKVVMIKNAYSIGIFNGEQGVICKVHTDRVKVDFGESGSHYFFLEQLTEENNKKFAFEENDDVDDCDNSIKMLNLAYAITVHRSQGSEYPFVCFYLPDTIKSSSFINRRLIYTALTRPQNRIWIIGSEKLLKEGIKRKFPFRCEKLCVRLRENLPQVVVDDKEFIDTLEKDEEESNYFDEDDEFDEDNYCF